MRVLIIADESFASRERAMLARIEVGLADEGVRIVHAIPSQSAHWHHAEVYSQTILYQDRGLVISRPWRVKQMLAALRAAVGGDEGKPVDIVHAFGAGCWQIAGEIARQTGASLALEVVSASGAAAATAGRASGSAGPVYFLPDPALERPVRGDDPSIATRLTPWGVHTPAMARSIFEPGKAVSIVMAGSGADPDAWKTVVQAIAAIVRDFPDVMVFADAAGVRAGGTWADITKLRIHEQLTLIPDMEARRELTLQGDVLVLPESRGQQRSLTLDAMAAGMVVVAAADPLVSVLQDGRTARVVDRPNAEAWTIALRGLLQNAGEARVLAASAREHVRQHCRASTQVAAVVGAYEWMLAGESIPFGPSGNVR